MATYTCTCTCGQSRFTIASAPAARFFCHCTICQGVYGQPFADVTVLWANKVSLPPGEQVSFKKYRAPPALRRGSCTACGRPVVGFLRLAPFVQLAFVPAQNLPKSLALPAPSLHMFYNSRVADAHDDLPKYSGYWSSQVATTKLIMGRTFGGASA
jgi:hypothetical protein